jgi:hypothetical protein
MQYYDNGLIMMTIRDINYKLYDVDYLQLSLYYIHVYNLRPFQTGLGAQPTSCLLRPVESFLQDEASRNETNHSLRSGAGVKKWRKHTSTVTSVFKHN